MSGRPPTERKTTVTRARAEKELSRGADPGLERYTKHPNKHVRVKAARLWAARVGT